jgi:hypothetical protein
MLRNVTAVLFVIVLVFSMSTSGLAQDAAKKSRVEGKVAFSNKDKSTLAVRKVGGTASQRIVHYDDSTKWVSQYHGDKKTNTIDASQVADGDYVICVGTTDDKGEFHASTISKRLSHSPE